MMCRRINYPGFGLKYKSIISTVSGKDVVKALENGVSQYPKHEGRFPQVSGIKFVFDPSKPPGQRVEAGLTQIQDEYVLPDKVWIILRYFCSILSNTIKLFSNIAEDSKNTESITAAILSFYF